MADVVNLHQPFALPAPSNCFRPLMRGELQLPPKPNAPRLRSLSTLVAASRFLVTSLLTPEACEQTTLFHPRGLAPGHGLSDNAREGGVSGPPLPDLQIHGA